MTRELFFFNSKFTLEQLALIFSLKKKKTKLSGSCFCKLDILCAQLQRLIPLTCRTTMGDIPQEL